MSQNKFASNVIEKCLEHGDTTEKEVLIEEILGQTEGNDNLLVSSQFLPVSLLISFLLYPF